ncbi:MAG: glycosyltransferase [Candidatus Nealsonbacteria bacterium]|nr:glycosyltransferase [Candidatus Nealsonbacteria bacterium]
MKICYLHFDGAPTLEAVDNRTGGLNITLFNLSKSISSVSDEEVTLIWRADGKKNKYLKDLQMRGIRLVKIRAGQRKQLSREELEQVLPEFIDKVNSYLKNENFDIVQTAGSEAGFAMSLVKKRTKCDSSVWIHKNFATLSVRRVVVGSVPKEIAINDTITRREKDILERCDHVIASTFTDKKEVKDVFDIKENKISVVSPGVDHSIFKPPTLEIGRSPIVVTAGRMAKIKDYPFLLMAFKKVVEDNRKMKSLALLIIGGNKSERDILGLEETVKDLKLNGFVHFKDGVPNQLLANYFRMGKVVVGSSKHETFGRVPVEARACGTPFVVRDNSSYRDTANDGEGGYFTENNNEDDMADKITRILRLPFKEWQKLSLSAIKSTKKFSWKKSAIDHLALYKILLKNSRG